MSDPELCMCGCTRAWHRDGVGRCESDEVIHFCRFFRLDVTPQAEMAPNTTETSE